MILVAEKNSCPITQQKVADELHFSNRIAQYNCDEAYELAMIHFCKKIDEFQT